MPSARNDAEVYSCALWHLHAYCFNLPTKKERVCYTWVLIHVQVAEWFAAADEDGSGQIDHEVSSKDEFCLPH